MVIGICKFISSKLQMLPRPEFTLICIYKSNTSKLQILPNPTRHLQIHIQQVVDASNPDQASASPKQASCRYFRTRPDIYKSNTSKLQILPTPTRHLQIQYQQIADTSEPDQASAAPQNNKSKIPTGELSSQIRRWASLFHLYCISISSLLYLYFIK